MAESDIFTTEYGSSEYTVWFIEHQNGFTFKVKAGDLPWRECHERTHPTYAEAKAAAIKLAQQLIDQMEGR